MNMPFEYIKIDLRDFKSIKDLRRSLKDIGVAAEVAKYLFHIKDDKEIKIIFVDKVYFQPFAYCDEDLNVKFFQNVVDEMRKEKSLNFIPKSENKKINENTFSQNMSVDSILDKINIFGVDSLTKIEKDFLEKI